MSWIFILSLGLTFLAPMLLLLLQIETHLLQEVVSSNSFTKVLIVTFISGGGGALISLIVGLYFARPFAISSWRGRRIQRLLLLFPYLIPNFVLATAYVVGWNPTTGLLNSWIEFPFGLYGLWGMTFLFGVVHAPVAFLMLEEKIRRIEESLREAARLSGASRTQVLFKIEIPLLKPTLVAAFALCFALNVSAFAIPSWIGAPEKAYPLTYKIYQAIQVGGVEGMPTAASWSLLLFLSIVPALLFAGWSSRNEKRYAVMSGKAARKGHHDFSGFRFLWFQTVFWLVQILFWIAPMGSLLLSTLVPPGCLQSEGVSCLSEVTLKVYSYVLFDLTETPAAFKGSFFYGTLSALLIALVSMFSLLALSKSRTKLGFLDWIFSIPAATPGAIIALGLIVTYSGRFSINLYNTAWIAVLAFVIKHMNLSFQNLKTGIMNISPSLSEAARLSGANRFQVWQKIILPILRPEILGGFFLVLVPILGELTMSVFLVSPEFRSIGTLLFDLQDYADQASAAALSIILVFSILIINELTRLLSRGRLGF